MPRCAAIKADGTRCASVIVGADGLCHAHSPLYARGRRRGGRAGDVPTPGQIARRVLDAIARLEEGALGVKDAAVMGQLFNVLRGLAKLEHEIRHGDYEDRLRAIEDRLGEGAPRRYRR